MVPHTISQIRVISTLYTKAYANSKTVFDIQIGVLKNDLLEIQVKSQSSKKKSADLNTFITTIHFEKKSKPEPNLHKHPQIRINTNLPLVYSKIAFLKSKPSPDLHKNPQIQIIFSITQIVLTYSKNGLLEIKAKNRIFTKKNPHKQIISQLKFFTLVYSKMAFLKSKP